MATAVLHTGSTMRCDALSAAKTPLLFQGSVAHKTRCLSAKSRSAVGVVQGFAKVPIKRFAKVSVRRCATSA